MRPGAAARWARWLPFAVVAPVVLALLFSPAPEIPSNLPINDKVVHAVMFAALAVSLRWAWVGVRPTVVGLLVFGVVSEVVQAVLPIGRSGSVADFAADALGVLAGVALASRLPVADPSRAV